MSIEINMGRVRLYIKEKEKLPIDVNRWTPRSHGSGIDRMDSKDDGFWDEQIL